MGKLSHEENRCKVCVLCFKKTLKGKPIHETLKLVIKNYFLPNYDDSEKYPKKLCGSCYVAVYRKSKGVSHKEIEVHDYTRDKRMVTRDDLDHNKCQICTVARENILTKAPAPRKPNKKIKNYVKVCRVCLTEIRPGKRHYCCQSSRLNNMYAMAGNMAEPIAARTIRAKTVQPDGEVHLANARGNITKVKVNVKHSKQENQISHQKLLDIKSGLNLSANKTIKLAKHLRGSNRKAVQPGLKPALTAMLHELDDFFHVQEMNFTSSGSASNLKPVVLCKSVSGLIGYVSARRNVSNCVLKIGIDGGQNFLKICLNLEEGRQTGTKYKDSGVRKSLLIAVAPDVAENYNNISQIWKTLDLQNLEAIVTGDLKVINILAGVMANSAMHPCAFCTSRKNDLGSLVGITRTIGFVKDQAQKWQESGKVIAKARDYFNCVNPPLLYGSDETTILSNCPPPPLHVFLGLLNCLYNAVSAENPAIALSWANAAGATRHDQFGFAGRHCREMLKKRVILKTDCEKFYSVLEALSEVVGACFGSVLEPTYRSKIDEFCARWTEVGLPATPKLHMVKFHVAEFCQENQEGLARFSEQTTESIHQDFDVTWQNYKVPQSSQLYNTKLLNAVVAYNSSHVL